MRPAVRPAARHLHDHWLDQRTSDSFRVVDQWPLLELAVVPVRECHPSWHPTRREDHCPRHRPRNASVPVRWSATRDRADRLLRRPISAGEWTAPSAQQRDRWRRPPGPPLTHCVRGYTYCVSIVRGTRRARCRRGPRKPAHPFPFDDALADQAWELDARVEQRRLRRDLRGRVRRRDVDSGRCRGLEDHTSGDHLSDMRKGPRPVARGRDPHDRPRIANDGSPGESQCSAVPSVRTGTLSCAWSAGLEP